MIFKRQTWSLIVAALCIGAGLAFGSDVFAQALTEDQYFGGEGASALTGAGFAEAAGLATGDVTTTIAALIRIVLGFLGIVAVLFVIYGGFTFMTSGGNDDKIKKSRKMLTSAVIGLVIVLSAFTIVQFVLSRLIEATGGVTTDGPDDNTPDYPDGDPTPSDQFVLTSVNTECAEAMMNLQLQLTFSQRVSSESVVAGGITVETSGGTAVDGTFSVSGRRVTFTPSTVCADDADEFCFDAGTDYTLALDADILESTVGSSVDCSTTYPCSYDFTTGTAVDTEGPTMTMDAPEDDATVYVTDIELLQAIAVDDTGVSSADFTVDGDVVYQAALTTDSTEGALATTNYFYTADGTEWDTAGFEPGNYSVRAEGSDCAGHAYTSPAVTAVLRPAHCGNYMADEDDPSTADVDESDTADNCGGDECGACDGETCDSDDDCASGYCDESTGECVGVPRIDEVSPGDGAVGNLVTISGDGFGSTADEITFYNGEGSDDDVVISAYECNSLTQWSDDEIVVQLTNAMADGPVGIATADGYSDRTDDDYGPTITDFDMNGVTRPGICMLDPNSDVGNSPVDVTGNNFGSSQGTSVVYFTNYEASDYDGWSDTVLSVVVPLLNARSYRTQVWTGDYQCVYSDGSLVGGATCSEDSDCDVTDAQTCATMQCSESGDVCEEDADCSDNEECVSLRQGSNRVTFMVVDASAGEDPVIGSVDSGWEACSDAAAAHCGEDTDCSSDGSVTCDDAENWGPPGQYVTISGTGFGSSTGTVHFSDDAGYALGDTLFPDACGDDFWDDSEITVKVPSVYANVDADGDGNGDAIAFGTFELTVVAGGVSSDAVEFVILDDKPGPGICDLDPSSGPVTTTTVTIGGDNFQSSQGSGYVEFYDGQQVTSVDSWSADEIWVSVDPDAQTGSVFVVSNEGYESNSMNFEVSDCEGSDLNCSVTGTQCCSDGSCSTSCQDPIPTSHYAWMFSTGDIPDYPEVLVQCDDDYISPSPWERWNVASEVCLDSVLTVSFSTTMDTLSYDGTVSVYPCVGTDPTDVCASLGTAVSGSVSDSSTGGSPASGSTPASGGTLVWYPDADWDASTTYQATVSTSVQSTEALNMRENYVWEFTTAAATDKCTVDDVYVTPPTGTIDEEGGTLDYGAAPIANRCIVLACSDQYDWEWESSYSGASISTLGTDASYGCANTATALLETPAGNPAEISATISNVIDTPSDEGELTIDYADPEVTDYEPSCETACVNAGVNVYFNTAMQNGTSVFSAGPSGTVQMYECDDSLCDPTESTELSDLDVPIAYSVYYYTDLYKLSIDHDAFSASTWYRVVIDGAVQSDSGVELSEDGSNYPSDENSYYEDDFSWTFRTKDDADACAIDRIDVTPAETSATAIDERNLHVATPYGEPDDCSATGQALDASGYDWDAWSAADTTGSTAEINVASMESLSLTSELEDGCSSACLNAGSAVADGGAVCGDGTTSYGEECEGGSGCTDECLFEGEAACTWSCDTTGASCDQDADCQESCDAATGYCTVNTTTACTIDADCPYDGGSCVEDTGCCGDGLSDSGEECDDGNESDDDGCTTACLNNGANWRAAMSFCGNGDLDHSFASGGEDCDDGNATSGDGCSSDCLYEGGVESDGVYSICGNGGDPEPGEDCDDENADDGDGCSSECLYEGASACAFECDGGLDDGENCAGPGALTCDSTTDGDQDGDCAAVTTPCCGDGEVEYITSSTPPESERSEDCDDGNKIDGDGCSSECLNEGSSEDYDTPSYCGDGTQGEWEECEASSSATSASYAGNRGVSVILETAPLDVVDGEAGADVTATSGTVDGSGGLTLTCSCVEDSSCSEGGLTYGCGTSSCCFTRPTEIQRYPAEGASDVCRNSSVWVDFSEIMDEDTFDLTGDADNSGTVDASEYAPNLYLELTTLGTDAVDSTNCPSTYTEAQLAFTDRATESWIVRAWDWMVRSVRSLFGRSATAATYACLVPVTYSFAANDSDGSRVSLVLGDILEADATYRLVVIKDVVPTDATDAGVLSAYAVGIAWSGDEEDDSTFTTGSDVCPLEQVGVEDLGLVASLTDPLLDPSTRYFTEDGEIHQMEATPYTVRGGDLEEISPIPGVYDWDWGWTSSCDDDEADTACTNVIDMDMASVTTTSLATAEGNTGTELVLATATFADDNTFGDPGSVTGNLRVYANVCDNPPTIGFPYEDTTSNFTFFYCRDAGNADDTTDDLPELAPDGVVEVISYTTEIIQELIFPVDGTSDAIGVRVLANEGYLPPDLWYEDQGFTGSPADAELDGYAAVRDGNTVYVAAANQASDGTIYPNIYVISYTEDAQDTSQDIFDQILENWSFNSNDGVVTNVNLCMASGGSYPTEDGDFVSCEWDGDCVGVGDGSATCNAEKEELVRDTARLGDVTRMAALLEDYGDDNGSCSVTTDQACTSDSDCSGDETCEPGTPALSGGTFVSSMSVSAWPSWSAELGNALGEALPEDPINAFYGCSTDDGYEEETCWNPTAATFVCPDGSHVYGYRSSGGTGYDLSTQLEYTGGVWAYDLYDAAEALGTITAEYDYGGSATLETGFTSAEAFCTGTAYGDSALCGDGLIGSDEVCEIGDTSSDDCETSCTTEEEYYCSAVSTRTCAGLGVTCSSSVEDCVEDSTGNYYCALVSPTSCSGLTDTTSCSSSQDCVLYSQTTTCDESGTITTTCESDCSGFQTADEAEDAGGECVPFECGNGVVEVDNGEVCDDGSFNGTYGHCGDSCTLTDAFSCGDGYLAGGEDCDCGETDNFDDLTETSSRTDGVSDPSSWADINSCENSNGQYVTNPANTCAWDCTAPGPSCGDAEVNGDEECDGDYEAWAGALCADLSACSTDDDCDDGSACGDGAAACSTSPVCEDNSAGTATDVGEACDATTSLKADGTVCDSAVCSSFTYELTRTRTCSTASGTECAWDAWSDCASPDQYCGNGTVEGDEACDDGNGENTDACTNDCTENACGDDYVYSGVESCDDGDENGTACDAQYGGVCYSCTTNCQYVTSSGEYCGDGEINGSEFCDGSDMPFSYFFINSVTAERVRGTACEWTTDPNTGELVLYGGTVTGDADDDGAEDDTYTCRYLGVCNGGDYNGEPCTLDPGDEETSASVETSGTIPSQAYAGCGTGGSCVESTCADDCSSMCPFSFETAVVTVQTEETETAEESVDLYSYLGGTEPDEAVFYIPACSVATELIADVDTEGIDPPSVAVMFVTDLSNSMGYAVGSETAASSPDRRIDYVVEAMVDGMSELFASDLADIEIGHLAFSGARDGSNDTYDAGAGSPGYYFDYCDDSTDCDGTGSYLRTSQYESDLAVAAETYLEDNGNRSSSVARGSGYYLLQWTPTYLGIEAAIAQLDDSDADEKVLILLSDGNLSHDSSWARCHNDDSNPATLDHSECVEEIRTDLITATANSDISFFAAVVTSEDDEAGYIAHMSSDDCGTDYDNEDDCTGDYYFRAETSDEIATMYQEIIDSILGITFELTTDVDGTTETTAGSVVEGRNQVLPFPDNFECSGSEQGIPFTVSFTGSGYISLSDISLTYCPAP